MSDSSAKRERANGRFIVCCGDVSEKLPLLLRLTVWDVVLGCFFVLADDSEFELAFDSSLMTSICGRSVTTV